MVIHRQWITSLPNPRETLFGGNSNWRGPVWFPLNFLLIESLQRVHHYYGDDFKVEFPTGFGAAEAALGSGQRSFAATLAHFSAEGRAPRRVRRYGDLPERSVLARSDSVL